MVRKLYIGLALIGTILITLSCSGKTNDSSKEAMVNNSISTESTKTENIKTNESEDQNVLESLSQIPIK